ncbi:MAG: glycosyltransferase [Planctomycetota bacterium]
MRPQVPAREAVAPIENAETPGIHGRVLQIAFSCHPHESMESRIGWYRAVHAARRYHVTVLHGVLHDTNELRQEADSLGLGDRIDFVRIERCSLGKLLTKTATTYYAGYRLWHLCALKVAKRLHAEQPFDLVHQTTYSGYREPGFGWRLGVPFVWGPVGGTQAFPVAYLGQLTPRTAWIEVCRNAINWWQLRFSRRVRLASRAPNKLIAATQKAAADIRDATGREVPVQLETALDIPIGPSREPRDQLATFNILWSGRLRAWKTLPLLLKALPHLPADTDWRLRVLGVGPCEGVWKRLAERLGIADRIEWLGWPEYRQTLSHYRWAHAFAFTSMRDTSGTGLLEALSAGTPIVGVDHQGAAEIMTPDCALPVPVGSPRDTITGFATALTQLARDPETWKRLSDGARREATRHDWEGQADLLHAWYAEAMPTPAAPSQRQTDHAS